MTSPDANEEVTRRVRRAVGFKVMRDLQRASEQMQRDDQQRPWLLFKLLLIIAALALIGTLYLYLR